MGAAKRLRTNPRQLASDLVAKLDISDIAESVDIAGPGFLNIRLASKFLQDQLNAFTLVEPTGQPERVVVDYSSPNLAKEMHVGHLRSTVIGDAVVRTLELLGHNVLRQNHIGDWGTAFGRLLAYLDEPGQELNQDDQLQDIEKLYVEASRKFEEDAAFADRARAMVLALQTNQADAIDKWEHFMSLARAHMSETYARLDVSLQPEHIRGESSYNSDLAPLMDKLVAEGVATESDGALCIFMQEFKNKNDEIQPMIVRKSDGGFLYHTTDMAALRYRVEQLRADRILYFTDSRQVLHFEMLFAAGRLAKLVAPSVSLEHHPFGKILGKDGRPFKTRAGDNILLRDLLDEAIRRASALIESKSPHLDREEQARVAETVAIGAIKYGDLAKNRTNDYTFDWDEMLSFDGNTAPYLQYAFARVSSLFEKSGVKQSECEYPIELNTETERQLGVQLLRFQEVLEQVATDAKPHHLCAYLYELTVRFMRFYEQCPILSEADAVKLSRLALCNRMATTLQTGLDALGIRVLKRM